MSVERKSTNEWHSYALATGVGMLFLFLIATLDTWVR
jgi:hypothetical protein